MERKNWKLWIVAMLVAALVIMLAGGAASAENQRRTAGLSMTGSTEEFTLDVDTEKAASDFVDSLMGTGSRLRASNQGLGAQLTGDSLTLYNRIVQDIHAVAMGTRSSTEFTYPVEEIFGQISFTAEELGVNAIYTIRQEEEDGILWNVYYATDEAAAAIRAKEINVIKEAFNCLGSDCSFDLYWYDKSKGHGTSYSYGYCTLNEEKDYEEIMMVESISIRMCVSSDYSLNGYAYTVDTTKYGQAVSTAIAKAQEIVDANEGYDGYTRLLNYKDEICRLTDYNDDAADENNNTPYGNPWQAVWVFDNNPDTKVVCEGYSKAFKYLNDLSSKSDVDVILAEGSMDGGTGAGGHMWNIVRMEDGRNYMADITNCDKDTVGYPDKLFLKAPINGSYTEGYNFDCGSKNVYYSYGGNKYGEDRLSLADYGYLERPEPSNKLATPEAEIPSDISAGVPFNITINDVENADYYMLGISGPQYGDETEERRIKQSGNYMPEAYGLDEGSYTISLTAMSFDSDYENSDTAEITLAVTGQRPAIPIIVMPAGEIHWGDTVLIEARQDNAEAIRYEVKGLSEELRTQDGLAMIPVVADETADYVFRARANGAWSRQTDTYTLTATMGTIPELSMTVPETILQGQDVTVSGITAVPGARVYAYSLSGPDQNVYDEPFAYVYDEPFAIVYDEPFNPTDRTLTIPGYHFTKAGSYDISITAYRDRYGNMLSEAVGHITVTENTNLPDAPTAEWEEDNSSTEIYGKSRFTVTTTSGADRIYAFVYSEYDEGEVLPTAIDTNPDERVYTCELTNRRAGTLIACFAVYRNGFWSEVSEGVTHFVYSADEGRELGRVNFTCPRETVLGEDFTVQWSPVDHAEWYELEMWAGEEMLSCKTVPASGTSSYSQAVSTEGITSSGEYSVRVKAFAEGYDADEGYYTSIQLLDPKQRITVAGTQAPATANIVTMTLGNVTANRIRLRIDGADAGMYGVNPANGTVTLTIPIANRDGQIQVANYDTNSRKWGAWSYPVSGNDEFRAMMYGTTERTWYMGLEPYQGTEDGAFSNNTAIFYYEDSVYSGEQYSWSCVCLDGPDCFEVQQAKGDRAEAYLVPKNNITAGTAVYRVTCTVDNTTYVAETTINIVDAQETLPEIHLEEAVYTAETNNLGEWTTSTGNTSLILGDQRAFKTVLDGEGQTEYQQTGFMMVASPDQDSCLNCNYLAENGIGYIGDMLLVSGRKPGSDNVTVQVDLDGTNVRYYKTITAHIAGMMLPANLTKIEANAFEGIGAEAVYIPDGCTEIGAGAFRNCKKLKYVSYKQGTTIGEGAFSGCGTIRFDAR